MNETTATGMPNVVERDVWQAEIDQLRVREKAHTRAGDVLAAARRRLPMVEVDATAPLTGPQGRITLLDAFEGRRQLLAYFHMWHIGNSASDQCEGCTLFNGQVRELSYLHSRDITYATLCQGPYEASVRYRDFMGWDVPWYSASESLDALMAGRGPVLLTSYLRDGDRVFETYWTENRGVEAMDYSYALMDLTVFGRQEPYEDSPAGWPQPWAGGPGSSHARVDGRPIAQWPRVAAGHSDDLGATGSASESGCCH